MRKIFSVLLIIVMIMALTACGAEDTPSSSDTNITGAADDKNSAEPTKTAEPDTRPSNPGEGETAPTEGAAADNTQDTAPAKSLSMTVNSDSGELKVTRRAVAKTDGKVLSSGWTLFVYLCGTDLESDYAAATGDLVEMTEAAQSDEVRFIVQTGGTKQWQNDIIGSGSIQRYLIRNGDIKLLEVHSRTVIADYFVICTANSTTQVKSLADELEYQMTLCNTPPAHTDGMGRGEWSVLDFSSVIVHIFIKSAREFYKLDKLWGDTTELAINSEE